MRKKSKKKQIVAMALALSVFASTFGTLGPLRRTQEPFRWMRKRAPLLW